VDEDLGLAYLPVETPTSDYYGGQRPGDNLFAESVVCLDLRTGQRKWHYQLVHHGIWDMDIPCAPMLVDINVNGRAIKALAQPTKQAFLYVFDRVTGQPVWPIEERPVEQSTVPGEKTSPTQPFPTKPPAYDRHGFVTDDVVDFTPELHAEAMKILSKYKLGPIFTPPVVSKPEGPLATLSTAINNGGTVWPGGSYDPETHTLYVYSRTVVATLGLVPPPDVKTSDMNYVSGIATTGVRTSGGAGSDASAQPGAGPAEENARALSVQGLPLVKPPYGRITAIDMDKGEIKWQIAHGETPDNIRNHPALKGLNIPRTGRAGIIGTLVTKTLVVAGEAGFFTTPSGQRGAMLRAYDKATGKEVGSVYMSAPQTGTPMTYSLNGKQYIVVAIGGNGYPAEFVSYRLPN